MKHLLRGLFIAVLFICCNFQLVLAQPMQELPVDKNVRIGPAVTLTGCETLPIVIPKGSEL